MLKLALKLISSLFFSLRQTFGTISKIEVNINKCINDYLKNADNLKYTKINKETMAYF